MAWSMSVNPGKSQKLGQLRMPFLQDGRVALSVAYLFPVIIQFRKGDRRGDRNFLENAAEMRELM